MKRPIRCLTGASAIVLLSGMPPAIAEEAKEDVVELEKYTTEDEIEDPMGLMPTEPVESVFGFGKTVLETPCSVTSVTAETIERLGINDIDDLVVVSPGAFTQSFLVLPAHQIASTSFAVHPPQSTVYPKSADT